MSKDVQRQTETERQKQKERDVSGRYDADVLEFSFGTGSNRPGGVTRAEQLH